MKVLKYWRKIKQGRHNVFPLQKIVGVNLVFTLILKISTLNEMLLHLATLQIT
jgi:hypothetical protein